MKPIQDTKELEQILGQDNIRTVQLIYGNNPHEIGMVIGTRHWSEHHTIKKEFALEVADHIWEKPVVLFIYADADLPKAWADSYRKGGIPEEEWDRRTTVHPYDEMNEQFSIDEYLLGQILKEDVMCPVPEWKEGVIEWYRKRVALNPYATEKLKG